MSRSHTCTFFEELVYSTIGTTVKLKPLHLSEWMPYVGYWVMAVGTVDGFEGSVAFANVLNTTYTDILIIAAISHGNSGGPLVDNEGNVVGTNTWGPRESSTTALFL